MLRRRTLLVAIAPLALVLACSRDPSPSPAPTSPVASPSPSTEEQPTRAPAKPSIRYIERVTGGAGAEETLPLVVAIHGLGDKPEHFQDAFQGVAFKARFVFPAGFDRFGDGWSWFPIGSMREPARFAEVTRASADRLVQAIEELSRARPTKGKPIVTGFSQGGMLSFTIAACHPDAITAAFPLSGTLAPSLVPTSWPGFKPPVHAYHGTADDRVGIDGARAAIARFKELGVPAEITEYPGVGHAIPDEELKALFEAMDKVVKGI